MPFVDTRAGTVAYQDRGQGPVLILLHATLHDHRDFAAVAPVLERSYRVISLDWPGCGDSPAAAHPEELTAALLADALEDIVDHLDVGPVLAVGNSVGGFAAARLAITRPQAVAGLILVNTGGFIPMNLATRAYCRLMGTAGFVRLVLPSFARLYMKPRTSLDYRVLDAVLARAKTDAGAAQAAALWRSFVSSDHDLRSAASALSAPTLLVWGGRDISIPLSAGRATHAVLPQAQFAVLDTGHVPFASAPNEFLALAVPFLQSALTGQAN
jgi:pimeloyl-ACP methyl ester carboxylesterase